VLRQRTQTHRSPNDAGLRRQHERTDESLAVEAVKLVKDFGDTRAVDGVSLSVPTGSIYGLLGPNGAGKTTILRMLIGIIDPSSGTRRILGREHPLDAAQEVGYLPEERGLYPAMHARDAIAFMGALRGVPLAEGRRRADTLLQEHNLGDWARKPIRTLSKGMAQTVQLLGTILHRPRLIVLDEPFAGLDAINQGRLEELAVYERERRRWLPHVTVLRFRRRPGLRPALPELAPFVPSDAAAYLSRLHPTGARYEVLERVSLIAGG